MSGYFADPDVTPEESAAALDALAAKHGVTEDVAALRGAGQNGAMTLVEFLRARLAEDELIAKRAAAMTADFDEPLSIIEGDELVLLATNPARVLAEVEAKRRIADEHGPNEYGLCDVCVLNDDARRAPCPTLRLLALPYASHPDYRQEWRP